MKKITLSLIIKEQKKDAKFAEYYQKELLINQIANMVVKLRKAAHLTQAQLALKAGTTQPVIARLESGTNTRTPSLNLLARIALASNAYLQIGFNKRLKG